MDTEAAWSWGWIQLQCDQVLCSLAISYDIPLGYKKSWLCSDCMVSHYMTFLYISTFSVVTEWSDMASVFLNSIFCFLWHLQRPFVSHGSHRLAFLVFFGLTGACLSKAEISISCILLNCSLLVFWHRANSQFTDSSSCIIPDTFFSLKVHLYNICSVCFVGKKSEQMYIHGRWSLRSSTSM